MFILRENYSSYRYTCIYITAARGCGTLRMPRPLAVAGSMDEAPSPPVGSRGKAFTPFHAELKQFAKHNNSTPKVNMVGTNI